MRSIILALVFIVISTGRINAMTFSLSSPAFENEKAIPTKYTCEGSDISPELKWAGAPDNTRSFVLIVDDPDAPDPKASKMTWVHWVVFNIPATTLSLPESAKSVPAGALTGLNSWKRTTYGGPCPPIGRHRYFFKLYALDSILKASPSADKHEIESLMKGHIVAQTVLMGTYQKSGR